MRLYVLTDNVCINLQVSLQKHHPHIMRSFYTTVYCAEKPQERFRPPAKATLTARPTETTVAVL